jgi:hypothetical protein
MLRHILFWFILMIIGIANGVLRGTTYGKVMSDLAAHQLSTVTGILLTGLAVWILWKYNPLDTTSEAWIVGGVWLLLTVLFEFGFGHYVAGHSWSALLADYNLFKGRVWVLFLGWIAMMPYFFYRVCEGIN